MKKGVWFTLGGLAVGGVVVGNLLAGSGPRIEVSAEPVRRGTVVSRVSASGRVYPVTEVKINSEVSGRIARLQVREGQQVRRGQILVELDPALYQARVAAAEAALRSQQAGLEAAEATLRQARDLLTTEEAKQDRGIGVAQQLRDARNNFDAAQARRDAAAAQVASAIAQLDQTRDDLARTTIRAPMDGIVTALAVEEGETVLGTQMSMGTQLMAVSDLSRMQVQVDVDETDIVSIAPGQRVEVEVDALPDVLFPGQVTEIASAGITTGRGTQLEVTNFSVKAVLERPGERLRPGMSAAVDIITAVREGTIYIPIQALTARRKEETGAVSNEQPHDPAAERIASREEWEEVVFVVTDDGRTVMRQVETGITGTAYIEIVDGVREGEKVVTGPFQVLSRTLKDGDRVKVEEAAESAPAGPGI